MNLAGELFVQKFFKTQGAGYNPGNIDAGPDPQALHQLEGVLGGNVTGGTRHKGTPAHAGQGCIKPGNAALQGR